MVLGIPKKIYVIFAENQLYPILRAASDSRLFDEIHVSTDCPEIASIVENEGYLLLFLDHLNYLTILPLFIQWLDMC